MPWSYSLAGGVEGGFEGLPLTPRQGHVLEQSRNHCRRPRALAQQAEQGSYHLRRVGAEMTIVPKPAVDDLGDTAPHRLRGGVQQTDELEHLGHLGCDTLSWRGTMALALLALACGLRRWRCWRRETLIEFCQQRLETFHQGGTAQQHRHLVNDSSVCKLPTQTLQLRQQVGIL